MSRYRKVEVKTWVDAKFRSLSKLPPSGQSLWLYLMTGPHTGPIPGLFQAGRAGMAESLRWSPEAFGEAFAEVLGEGMAEADFEAQLVWLPKALRHNKPESPNVVRGWRDAVDLLPECALKRRALAAIREHLKTLGSPYVAAFDEVVPAECYSTPLKPSGKASPKASRKAMPNQEQEQEQEQDKYRESTAPDGAAHTAQSASLTETDDPPEAPPPPPPPPTPAPTPAPSPRPKRKAADALDRPEDVDQQTWDDWVRLRKGKRAGVTATAVAGARDEAAKAGLTLEQFLKIWCTRGSQGLEASWIRSSERPAPRSFAEAEREAGWARWEEMTGRKHPELEKLRGDVIDATPSSQPPARIEP